MRPHAAPTDPSGQGTKPSPERNLALDGLRGIAALWVVLFHFTQSYGEGYGDYISPVEVGNGPFAVYLFLMISGYVILMTLDRCVRMSDFAAARFARLYPAYWVAVALAYAISAGSSWYSHKVSFTTFLVNLTMFQRFFGFENVDGVYWSLRIELTFYLLLAALVSLGLRARLLPTFGALVVLDMFDRSFDLFESTPAVRSLLILDYAYMFLFGMLMYEARNGWSRLQALLAAVCLTDAVLGRSDVYSYLVLPLFGLVFLATHARVPVLGSRALAYLGAISYSLYLVHAHLGFAIIHQLRAMGASGMLSLGSACAGVVLAAVALHHLVEVPGNRLIRGWFRKRSATDPRTPRTG